MIKTLSILMALLLISMPVMAYNENVKYKEDTNVKVERADSSPVQKDDSSIVSYLNVLSLCATAGIIMFIFSKKGENKK